MAELSTDTAVFGRRIEEPLRREMQRVQQDAQADIGGGSSFVKALVLGDLIVAHDLRRVVELGVYRGRLLLPLGRLLTGLGRGEVIGIDPYDAIAAAQTDAHEVNIDLVAWSDAQDWDGLHDGVVELIDRWQIGAHTRLRRQRSADAAADFPSGSIDLLHVDGNHDAGAVAEDLASYLPAMRRGGYVVLDDISWRSVGRSYHRLLEEQRLVFSLSDAEALGGGGNDFAVFQIVGEPGTAGGIESTAPPAAVEPELERVKLELRRQEAALAAIQSSTSWRLTQPLRDARRRLSAARRSA